MVTDSGRSVNMPAACTAAAGLIFCLWVLTTGGEALCVTDGCGIFRDFRLAGYSLWEAGAALFGSLALLSLLRLSTLALILSFAALLADAVLLGVMIFTAPCLNCLIVGALTAICYLCLLHGASRGKESGRSLLACAWTLLFLFNIGGLVREASHPWAVLAPEKPAAVNIWFSPSCPACRQVAAHYENLPGAAWHPVAEDPRDLHVIRAMDENLKKGMPLPEAIEKARAVVPAMPGQTPAARLAMLRPSMLLLQFRLWVNQAHVLAAGSGRLPLIEFSGLPSFLAAPARQDPHSAATPPVVRQPSPAAEDALSPSAGDSKEPALPSPQETQPGESPSLPEMPAAADPRPSGEDWQDFGVAGFCGGEKKEPCDGNPAPAAPQAISTDGML